MAKKALILIDFINGICGKDSGSSSIEVLQRNDAYNKINHLLEYARSNDWLIIWIIVGFDQNYLLIPAGAPIFAQAKEHKKLQLDSDATKIIPELNYLDGELIIAKNAVNPFHATNLDHALRNNGVDEIYLAGVATEIAIQSCTRDAHDRGYKVNVIADLCAGRVPEFHDASLKMLTIFASVINSGEIN
ncbi:MAG: cysteine hydrolase [Burkholderiales bacterium]|nr:cysteine hydrolase [Burkholderiales bacterium]